MYIYVLNKVFSQVSAHTYIVLQESKGKKQPHDTQDHPFPGKKKNNNNHGHIKLSSKKNS